MDAVIRPKSLFACPSADWKVASLLKTDFR